MFWNLLYRICSWYPIYSWLYNRIDVNPYWHIKSPNQTQIYMLRGWVNQRNQYWWQRWFKLNFCVRIHHIMVPDGDRHLHSHPFNFRTIVLRGAYVEQKYSWLLTKNGGGYLGEHIIPAKEDIISTCSIEESVMHTGDTAIRYHGEFHRISYVPKGGAVTLFFMWGGERDDWGFMTEEGYVQNEQYFKERGIQEEA